MIVLKPIIFYPGHTGCEATWVDTITLPQQEISEGVTDLVLRIKETQLKCHSYHPTQMGMLRADAAYYGTPLTDYEAQIAEMEAGYVPPAPLPTPVPHVITIRQAKLVLLAAGLLDDVDAAVAQADRATQIEWEYATEVNRTWHTLVTLQAALGLSDQQVDDLFIQGSSL